MGDLDGLTSANSEFRMNKRFLTNIRERRNNGGSSFIPDSTSTYYSSVVSTIKAATSTPKHLPKSVPRVFTSVTRGTPSHRASTASNS